MFRKIRNIRNLGNFHIRGPHIVMSRTDAQNGLDFPFKLPVIYVGNQVIRSNTEPYLHYHCSTPIYATRTCYLFLQHKGRTIRFLREGGGWANISGHEFFSSPNCLQ